MYFDFEASAEADGAARATSTTNIFTMAGRKTIIFLPK